MLTLKPQLKSHAGQSAFGPGQLKDRPLAGRRAARFARP